MIEQRRCPMSVEDSKAGTNATAINDARPCMIRCMAAERKNQGKSRKTRNVHFHISLGSQVSPSPTYFISAAVSVTEQKGFDVRISTHHHRHPMAKPRLPKKTLDSYTIKGTNKVIRAGDCVLMRAADPSKPPYVAKVEKIEANGRGSNVQVRVRWYYRPEESIGGRRQFHGAKEVFLSDHYDAQSADTIEGKCIVHSFKSYTKLDAVGNEDFFCRFEYKSATGGFNPDRVAV
ncbi:hypothetical protein ACLOJK_037785 [Asimina triloba]